MASTEEEWLTTFDAARIAGYHPNYLRKLLRKGDIKGRKWGPSWQVDRASLTEYMSKIVLRGEKRGPKMKHSETGS